MNYSDFVVKVIFQSDAFIIVEVFTVFMFGWLFETVLGSVGKGRERNVIKVITTGVTLKVVLTVVWACFRTVLGFMGIVF